jgi:hypothetical protein
MSEVLHKNAPLQARETEIPEHLQCMMLWYAFCKIISGDIGSRRSNINCARAIEVSQN